MTIRYRSSSSGGGEVGCVAAIIYLVLLIGWIINIIKFCQCDFKESYKAEIIRGVGIVTFFPGAVMGYISQDTMGK